MRRTLWALLLSLAVAASASAQSQSINGTIEGTVTDESGAVLPGVTVTLTNVDTGDTRVVVTGASGLYRAPLLPLGTYRVGAELQGFKKFEQTGVTLGAGQARVINVSLSVGTLSETVSVTADAPLVDLGKIEQGRTLGEREIKELPLTSRNPYNFALLQPGVVGFETQEFGVPRLTANGALLRVNYQIDGSNNTQKDRAGLRQMPMSEVMIREVKVVTTGYAPEFGQTMGLIYNAITPSGTNRFKGQGSYRMQRDSFAAYPFFFQGARTATNRPPTEVNLFTADLGGPIVKDKLHFFAGVEHTERDLSGSRVITISAANQAALGLREPGAMPAALNTEFAIGKLDYSLNQNHRLSARTIFFDNFITNNIGGGLTSVQRGTDFSDRQYSSAVQLVSTLGSKMLNELRVQYATRAQSRAPGSQAGSGPAINIAGVANIGGPIGGGSDAGFAFTQDVFQVNNNLSVLAGDHQIKVGIDFQNVADGRTQTRFQQYTFANLAAYQSAVTGANRFGYQQFTQFFGNPDLSFSSNLWGAYIQDDWRVSPNLKLLYGLRYDLYDVPDPDSAAPYAASRDFTLDTNNLAPRAGLAWTVGRDRRTVVRANTGLMYDQPLLAVYERALIADGSASRVTVAVQPTTLGAPAFPATLENTPPGFVRPVQSIASVDPDFEVARSWQNNVQIERGLSDIYAAALGFTYTRHSNLPVINNVNLQNPTGSLPDGRPIYSTAVNATTRVNPAFNNIDMVQSNGEGDYKAMTLQFSRRNTRGIQFDFAYTLGKSNDNAPITSVLSVQGDTGRSDPSNLDRDRGPNVLDQRHTFIGSIVAQPEFSIDNRILEALLNHNQFGLAIQLASGIPVNLRANRDLNNDGNATSDRPNGVARNSLNLPARRNVDLRYSRKVRIRGSLTTEVVGEIKNVLNTVQWSSVNNVIAVDTLGNPTGTLPTTGKDLVPTGGYEQRQFQLGFRFTF